MRNLAKLISVLFAFQTAAMLPLTSTYAAECQVQGTAFIPGLDPNASWQSQRHLQWVWPISFPEIPSFSAANNFKDAFNKSMDEALASFEKSVADQQAAATSAFLAALSVLEAQHHRYEQLRDNLRSDAEKQADSISFWKKIRVMLAGMHSGMGFDNFIKLNQRAGKTFNIVEVTEFTTERLETAGEILSQTLANGVRRVQLPREAWANSDAVNSAIAFTESGQRLKGVKTFFPDSWDIAKIAEATDSVARSELSSVKGKSIEGVFEGVKIKVFLNASGRVETSFPLWRQ